MKLTAQERQLLQQANNAEGFVTTSEVSEEDVHSLIEKEMLLYYDACYWITYEGEDALKGIGADDEPAETV